MVLFIQKEAEGDGDWPIIHEDGKLVVETICCPLAFDIYFKKMTTEMATNLNNKSVITWELIRKKGSIKPPLSNSGTIQLNST